METLEEWLVKELTKRHASITTAESCTGGLVSGRIVNVGGASSVFNQGFVTYSNEAKRDLLGVKQETLDSVGAVSPETAEQMARGGAKQRCRTPEKPVGLVYIGCCCYGETVVERHMFKGNRMEIRNASVETALTLAKKCLKE